RGASLPATASPASRMTRCPRERRVAAARRGRPWVLRAALAGKGATGGEGKRTTAPHDTSRSACRQASNVVWLCRNFPVEDRMRYVIALIAALVAISLSDWLLFGVVFHKRYDTTPASANGDEHTLRELRRLAR